MIDQSLEELTRKISDLREKLDETVRELRNSSQELRTLVIKSADPDSGPSYLAFASAHMRLASMISSEVHKTGRTEVRIVRARKIREEESRLEVQRQERRAAAKKAEETEKAKVSAFNLPPVDTSFEELYGDVIDAE